jgi:hypothetical protein
VDPDPADASGVNFSGATCNKRKVRPVNSSGDRSHPRISHSVEVPMKMLLAVTLSLMALASKICTAGNWVAAPQGSSVDLVQRIERANWIGAGAKSSTRVVYVFLDPDCPYCNALWRAMQVVRAPEVQIRYLLVAVIDEDSRGKDATILESSDPAAALTEQERTFDRGGLASKATVQPTTAKVVAANEALMRKLHIFGTPGVVYRDEQAELKVFAGMPDPQQLKSIAGRR